ncbi:MAG: hypothetical protein WAN44_13965 [Propionibacteriaceae bacterium]
MLSAVPNLRHLEWFHDHVRIERMRFDSAPTMNGELVLDADAPGNGLTWLSEAAERYRVG